jgi:hypothetical protein
MIIINKTKTTINGKVFNVPDFIVFDFITEAKAEFEEDLKTEQRENTSIELLLTERLELLEENNQQQEMDREIDILESLGHDVEDLTQTEIEKIIKDFYSTPLYQDAEKDNELYRQHVEDNYKTVEELKTLDLNDILLIFKLEAKLIEEGKNDLDFFNMVRKVLREKQIKEADNFNYTDGLL